MGIDDRYRREQTGVILEVTTATRTTKFDRGGNTVGIGKRTGRQLEEELRFTCQQQGEKEKGRSGMMRGQIVGMRMYVIVEDQEPLCKVEGEIL